MKLLEIKSKEPVINSAGISSIKNYLAAAAKMQKIPKGFKTITRTSGFRSRPRISSSMW